MIKKDYFLRLVEELGKTIRQILALRQEEKLEEANELIEETYKGYFRFNAEYLLKQNDEDIIDVLIKDNNLSEEHIRVLADLLLQEGEINYQWDELMRSKNCLRKSHILLEYINQKNIKTFSIERKEKIDRIMKWYEIIESEIKSNN